MNRALFAAAMLISLCGQLVAGEKLTYEQHIRPIFALIALTVTARQTI